MSKGKFRFLQALEPPGDKPVISLGSTGRWSNDDYVTIGYLRRSIEEEDVRYPWTEYLLYHPRRGFRWLVCSDAHWSFVEPQPPGTVETIANAAHYEGKRFKLFQKAQARVDHVLGEFYWRIEIDETVDVQDYIRPPWMLSCEMTRVKAAEGEEGTEAGEINWSLGTYVPPAEIEQKYAVENLPRPAQGSVAPNQPFMYNTIYRPWAVLSGIAVVLWVLFLITASQRTVFDQTIALLADPSTGQPPVFFSEPFELGGWCNLQVKAQAPVENSWVEIEGDLINEETGLVQAFDVPVSYFHGVEDGESWSEGRGTEAVYLSAVPFGKYTLRLEFHSDPGKMPATVHVHIRQGMPRLLNFGLTLLALAAVPVVILIWHLVFEVQRWKDSAYSPFHRG